jgi:uncharacterized protein YecT (DUF1311 family)
MRRVVSCALAMGLAGTVAWVSAGGVVAQDAQPKALVVTAAPPVDLDDAKRRLRIAQDELDAVVKLAEAMIKAKWDLKAQLRNDWIAALAKSQREWTTYRETDCDHVVNREKGLPTTPSAESLLCKAQKATERAEELKKRYRR